MIKKRIFASVLLGVGTVFLASQVAAQDVIEQRIKLMKANGAASKALKAAVPEKDYATIQVKAKDIAEGMGKVEALFPKGSTSDKSRALPAIWEKWDDFTKDTTAAKKAAAELADAAAAKDASLVDAKYKALGKACGDCHKPFRAEKK